MAISIDSRIRYAGQFGHDEPARTHDGGHEHSGNGTRPVRYRRPRGGLNPAFFIMGMVKVPVGNRVGDGAARNGPEKTGGDDGPPWPARRFCVPRRPGENR